MKSEPYTQEIGLAVNYMERRLSIRDDKGEYGGINPSHLEPTRKLIRQVRNLTYVGRISISARNLRIDT